MAFRTSSVGSASFYTCTCERCGYSSEPIEIQPEWASTVKDRVKDYLERKGWGFHDGQSWCIVCWIGIERAIQKNIEAQAS